MTGWEIHEGQLPLLDMATSTLSRVLAAREAISIDGLVAGTRVHPAARIEMDGTALFARLLRQLNLEG